MKKFFYVSLTLGFIFFVYIAVLCIKFNQDCKGHLKRAADANTIEIAESELKTAIDYLEANGDTIGYTSVVYKTPNEDIGFWYHNLKASYNELISIPDTASNLEKTNTLMKLRETLLDTDSNGDTITCPPGMAKYPNNMLYGCIWIILLILIIVSYVKSYE